ncbi:MFS transporter [Rhodococcus sp. CX]|uniref:MFS transporter n=1 Tax=Rhodococcus sp. CX TaxID=2789880 RepID=UPI0018CEB3C9|nr:MFS transporter [Rhodococcus sp. CX]MBH0121048.1 MFS transporter [Rhodococcus sp. CX]
MEQHSQAVRPATRFAPLLVALAGAPFIASLDLFVVNIAFGELASSFPDSSLGALSWVLSGYAVVYAALLVPLGRWADRIGRKRGFLTGLALFTVASAACALSPTLEFLVAARLLQAVGAAALTPASLGLLVATLPADRRAAGVRVWAATGAAAAALGPVVGGLLVELSWRWVFLVNVPIGVALLMWSLRTVPESRDVEGIRDGDLPGAALLAAGVGAAAFVLVEGPERGWTESWVTTAGAVAVVALGLFVRRIRSHRAPLVDPALLRVPGFAWSNVAAVSFSATFAGGLLATVLWLQQVWSYSALHTGLAIAPGPLLVPVFAAAGQVLARRLSPGTIAAAGSALWGAGALLILATATVEPNYATGLLPGWLLAGAGVGLALPTILAAATAVLPPAQAATGSAVVNAARQIGTVLGVAATVTALSAGGIAGFHRAWWVVAAIAVLTAVAALRITSPAAVSAPIDQEPVR